MNLCPNFSAAPSASPGRGIDRLQRRFDWRKHLTNCRVASLSVAANQVAGIRTHDLRCQHVRLRARLEIHSNLTASQKRQPFRVSFTFISPHFFSPGLYWLWAWGCHIQKTSIWSLYTPAAWARRKRTGRQRKVRGLFWGELGYHHSRLNKSRCLRWLADTQSAVDFLFLKIGSWFPFKNEHQLPLCWLQTAYLMVPPHKKKKKN